MLNLLFNSVQFYPASNLPLALPFSYFGKWRAKVIVTNWIFPISYLTMIGETYSFTHKHALFSICRCQIPITVLHFAYIAFLFSIIYLTTYTNSPPIGLFLNEYCSLWNFLNLWKPVYSKSKTRGKKFMQQFVIANIFSDVLNVKIMKINNRKFPQ